MKRFAVVLFIAVFLFSALVGCGGQSIAQHAPTPTPTSVLGGANAGKNGGESTPPVPTVPPIPPDSIWTLKADINHRQVLEEGYFADYTVELDFIKLDGAYPSGQYIGDIYISLKLDAEDFIKDMLKNLPVGAVNINFDAQGYGLRNSIPVHVFGFTEFQKEGTPWPSAHTKNKDGEQISPGAEEYLADTAFAMGFESLLTAGAEGSTGGGSFKLGDFSFNESGDEDIKLRLIIEPDAVWGNDFYTGTGGTRNVRVFIEVQGVGIYGEGTLERLPRGEENQSKQLNRERLGEKHGVEETA
ncbi:MAG TPA: hypothetical protein PKX46_04765 [Clostridia bacterium]|nr:hypothetical protein [Clostridia bacterium]